MYMKLCAPREQPSTGLLMWVNELGGVVTEVSEEGKATDARLMIVTSLCIDRLDPNPGCLCYVIGVL